MDSISMLHPTHWLAAPSPSRPTRFLAFTNKNNLLRLDPLRPDPSLASSSHNHNCLNPRLLPTILLFFRGRSVPPEHPPQPSEQSMICLCSPQTRPFPLRPQ